MRLTLIRTDMLPDKTFGLLDCDGKFICHTLEDTDRQLEIYPARKVYGETAIPRGSYALVLDYSMRFKRILPHVLGVRGFEAIRLHAGNTKADTHGCPLLGDVRTEFGLRAGSSRPALERLMKILSSTNERITLEVK